MSSILKALKKLEEEKTTRRPDSLKIDAEILRGDASQRISPLSMSLLAGLLLLSGSGGTYLYLKHDTGSSTVSGSKSTPNELPAGRPQPILPATIAPSTTPDSKVGQAIASRPGQPVAPIQAQGKSHSASPSPASLPMTLSKVQQKRQPLQPVLPIKTGETEQQMLQTQQSEQPAGRSVTPTLKVNGIAFQEGVAGSVAVVNGISVSSGSMIEGAKVEDIQMDRVRFSYSGEKFEVLLGKSNR